MSSFLNYFYILDNSPLLDVELMEIFSHSVGCHFILSAVFFALKKSFKSWKVVHRIRQSRTSNLGFIRFFFSLWCIKVQYVVWDNEQMIFHIWFVPLSTNYLENRSFNESWKSLLKAQILSRVINIIGCLFWRDCMSSSFILRTCLLYTWVRACPLFLSENIL